MKHLLVALFSTCIFFSNMFGEYPPEWLTYKKKVLTALPSILGWCPKDKAERMMNLVYETKPAVYVEVGIFGGSSYFPTVCALHYNKKGIGYAIDPWENLPCMEGQTGAHYDWWKKVDLRAVFYGFVDLMHNYKLDSYSAILRMTSQQALKFFQDSSIDILHIDGNHAEASALFDAQNWLPKVKVGGYIWFDDTDWDSTQKAVQYLLEYCEKDPSSNMRDPYMLFKKVRSEKKEIVSTPTL